MQREPEEKKRGATRAQLAFREKLLTGKAAKLAAEINAGHSRHEEQSKEARRAVRQILIRAVR